VPVCGGTSAALMIIGMQNWKCVRKPLSCYLSTTSCTLKHFRYSVIAHRDRLCQHYPKTILQVYTGANTPCTHTFATREKFAQHKIFVHTEYEKLQVMLIFTLLKLAFSTCTNDKIQQHYIRR